MQDGQPLHRGVAAVLLGKALSGDLMAASTLAKIVNDKERFGGGDNDVPQEIKITIVNANAVRVEK
jgi:hypothetical protein